MTDSGFSVPVEVFKHFIRVVSMFVYLRGRLETKSIIPDPKSECTQRVCSHYKALMKMNTKIWKKSQRSCKVREYYKFDAEEEIEETQVDPPTVNKKLHPPPPRR
jgi:hypothetical protein